MHNKYGAPVKVVPNPVNGDSKAVKVYYDTGWVTIEGAGGQTVYQTLVNPGNSSSSATAHHDPPAGTTGHGSTDYHHRDNPAEQKPAHHDPQAGTTGHGSSSDSGPLSGFHHRDDAADNKGQGHDGGLSSIDSPRSTAHSYTYSPWEPDKKDHNLLERKVYLNGKVVRTETTAAPYIPGTLGNASVTASGGGAGNGNSSGGAHGGSGGGGQAGSSGGGNSGSSADNHSTVSNATTHKKEHTSIGPGFTPTAKLDPWAVNAITTPDKKLDPWAVNAINDSKEKEETKAANAELTPNNKLDPWAVKTTITPASKLDPWGVNAINNSSSASSSPNSANPTSGTVYPWHENPNWGAPNQSDVATAGLDPSQVLEQRPSDDNNKIIFRLKDGTYTAYNLKTGDVYDAGTWNAGQWDESGFGASSNVSSTASTANTSSSAFPRRMGGPVEEDGQGVPFTNSTTPTSTDTTRRMGGPVVDNTSPTSFGTAVNYDNDMDAAAQGGLTSNLSHQSIPVQPPPVDTTSTDSYFSGGGVTLPGASPTPDTSGTQPFGGFDTTQQANRFGHTPIE